MDRGAAAHRVELREAVHAWSQVDADVVAVPAQVHLGASPRPTRPESPVDLRDGYWVPYGREGIRLYRADPHPDIPEGAVLRAVDVLPDERVLLVRVARLEVPEIAVEH